MSSKATGWLISATKSPRAHLPPGPSTKRDQSTRRAPSPSPVLYYASKHHEKSRAESLTCETPRLVEEVNSETVRKQN